MPFYEITGQGIKTGRKRKPRRYFAKNETDAMRQAKKDGLEIENIDLIGVWGCVTQVAGCSHRNADNTSRQKMLTKIKPYDVLLLEHEIGNRHDKHATKVMTSNEEQLGYLPERIARDLIEGYWTDSGCDYWAVNLGVERMGDDTDLSTARILVLVSLPGLERVQECVKHELGRLKITEVSAEMVNWQSLRGVPRKLQSRDSKKEQPSGCLGSMLLITFSVIQLILCLLYEFN